MSCLPTVSFVTCAILCSTAALAAPGAEFASTKEGIVGTYRKAVPEESFDAVKARDEKDKPRVMQRQRGLLDERYDLADRPSTVRMSGGRRFVQDGVRVKLPRDMTWEKLSRMSPEQIRAADAFPRGFLPLPHVKHETGGQVFPQFEIDEIDKRERRSLQRFDVDFDLPDHLLPEFPAPVLLTTRPELGDVSKGQVLTIRNFFELMNGTLTPVQMEGLRLLLTPFPQEEFNATDDRKVAEPQFGVACLDCHSNFHTNGAFHLNPDTRPQDRRFRLDTTSLRGLFSQQIHGSKRSLRSVEDFTEFEQRRLTSTATTFRRTRRERINRTARTKLRHGTDAEHHRFHRRRSGVRETDPKIWSRS
jgi:cytochrome c peroxidase